MKNLELPLFEPFALFDISAKCPKFSFEKDKKLKKKHSLSSPLEERDLVDFAIGWHEKGLSLRFKVKKAFDRSFYPDFRRGDSIEFFLLTRPNLTSYITKYHHHFVFFPEKVEGVYGKEVTKFRASDLHELSDPFDIFVSPEINPNFYEIEVQLPKEVLFGYDPINYKELFFSYVVNRPRLKSIYFNVALEDFAIEKKPSLWSSLTLEK